MTHAALPDSPDRPKSRISFRTIQTATVFVLLIALCAVSAFRTDTFLTWRNLVHNLLSNASCTGLIAAGMTLVMITGGFDLSVAAITALASVVTVLALQALAPFGPAVAIPGAVLATLLAGIALGATNGALVAYVGVNAFVVTLSTMLIFRGIALVLTHGGQSIEVPANLSPVFDEFYWGRVPLPGTSYELTVPIVIFLVVFAIFFCGLRYSRFGHYVYAVGGNETASWLAGINTARVKMIAYTLCGMTCAIAAVIFTGMSKTAQAASYQGREMVVIASVIVGGTPLGGGAGGLLYTLNGLLLLSVIENLLTQFRIPEEYRNIVGGLIILIVVAIDVTVRRTTSRTKT